MFNRLTRAVRHWRVRTDTEFALQRLSDPQLHDIGMIRDEIPEIARRARRPA